jgi:hypothetical protein
VPGSLRSLPFFRYRKPPPVRRLEGLHGGLGIVADDAMAGCYRTCVISGGDASIFNDSWRPEIARPKPLISQSVPALRSPEGTADSRQGLSTGGPGSVLASQRAGIIGSVRTSSRGAGGP